MAENDDAETWFSQVISNKLLKAGSSATWTVVRSIVMIVWRIFASIVSSPSNLAIVFSWCFILDKNSLRVTSSWSGDPKYSRSILVTKMASKAQVSLC
ncbi:hypothetical protein P5673_021604 [Acropora cervicornis]|uniref:Uncharacterized protein n=1 Tax=Acropora cervicornis TaxID=6130 RepID=A0AAD9Q7W3_ACRCE|nr:hypothetical protein P5673_021604 [Acropora cervicornis]